MKTSEVYGRYRKMFQIITFAGGGLFLVLLNTELIHAQYMFRIAVSLILVLTLSIVLGIVYAFKEFSAQQAELRHPPPAPERPWQALNKDR